MVPQMFVTFTSALLRSVLSLDCSALLLLLFHGFAGAQPCVTDGRNEQAEVWAFQRQTCVRLLEIPVTRNTNKSHSSRAHMVVSTQFSSLICCFTLALQWPCVVSKVVVCVSFGRYAGSMLPWRFKQKG